MITITKIYLVSYLFTISPKVKRLERQISTPIRSTPITFQGLRETTLMISLTGEITKSKELT